MVLTSLPDPISEDIEVGPDRTRRPGAVTDPMLAAVGAMAVSAIWINRPSLWYDEAATISAASRPLPELWALVQNIDAVHGLYYLLMHGWLLLAAPSETFLRLSSVVAVGLAAAGVVVLGKQLSTRAVALTAAAVFAILPRVTCAAIEARSYALSMAAAVWLTVLLVRAVRRGGVWLWAAYSAALAASTALNVYVLLIAGAHGLLALMLSGRRGFAHWCAAASVAVIAVVPFLSYSRSQMRQVGWIPPLRQRTFGEVLVDQYFDHSVAAAVLAALLIVTAAFLRRPSPALPEGGARVTVAVTLAWILFPTAVLLGYSALAAPVYWPRYLTFTAPAVSLLLGVCIVAVARTPSRTVAVLVLCLVAATPNLLLAQRGPYAKGQMDYSQVADIIASHASPGDCLVLDNTVRWEPGPIRPLTAARPSVYAKLTDPGRGRTALDRNMLWDRHRSIWSWRDRIPSCPVLWTVSERDPTRPAHETGPRLVPGPRLERAPAYRVPAQFGFHVVERWQFSLAQVTRSLR
ncbi:glycosyltransferase family 39 protein [Mycolicibacterium confluentis]|uniref:Mannosyltransferase n=1 Tax=Mycolicibacterium confluentis TaxID=28047 RepID=A0A7I7XVM5_9MYCO|nr:glycosyltransferase family 39 protein [Mycolicibacterium confluentis]MCV7322639.1 glycosyltransferase family 39 protein [Mycolicibacterium confluentis]BBZ33308.1 mannosyltransferase [Mycolicibacterium confluentis]